MFLHMRRSGVASAAPNKFRRRCLVLIIILSILAVEPVAGLSCGPCNLEYCDPLNSTQCDYGVKKDACYCCDVCAKGPGDSCGGTFGQYGYCGEGYDCIVQVPFGSTWTKYYQTNGVCKANQDPMTVPEPTTVPTASQATEPADDDCRDKCSVEFCNDGKNRYCSATENAFEAQEERGVCQHTTCKACRLLVGPSCPTCPLPVNKRCLRKYFLCISEHYKEDNIMLELDDPLAQNAPGRIICHVPETHQETMIQEEGK